MLLFSTTLNVVSSMTVDDFIRLIIKWNQENTHSENIIKDMNWQGERDIRFGTENLWLALTEYRNILASRYEKIEADGTVWDTDYIMNFDTMKLCIQLDRSFKEDALKIKDDFSTPHFINTLIDSSSLLPDDTLPVSDKPLYITKDNLQLLSDLIINAKKYRLPVVYVSRTVFDTLPLDVELLSYRLKGAAHVLVESEKALDEQIRKACNDKNDYNGSIGIYYPRQQSERTRLMYRRYEGCENVLLSKTVSAVIKYVNSQNVENLYTWQGVNNALLTDALNKRALELQAAETAKQKAESETEQVYGTFDSELYKSKSQITELMKANEILTIERNGLRSKLDSLNELPVLKSGVEEDLYPGEIKDIILSELEKALKNLPEKSRRADILTDIIRSNNYEKLSESRVKKLKNIMKSYGGLTASNRQELKDLGLEIESSNKHIKTDYYGDDRYMASLSCTPGDTRSGMNLASDIIRLML